MAFVSITSGEIVSGEPVKASTLVKIKDDFDDHETRIEDLEAGLETFLPVEFCVNGQYDVADNVLITTANGALTITGARILIKKAGSSGTTQIDIQKKRGVGAFASIFSTLPSASYTNGDLFLTTNGILDLSEVGIQAGDILRLDIKSIQTGGSGFIVRIDYDRG